MSLSPANKSRELRKTRIAILVKQWIHIVDQMSVLTLPKVSNPSSLSTWVEGTSVVAVPAPLVTNVLLAVAF